MNRDFWAIAAVWLVLIGAGIAMWLGFEMRLREMESGWSRESHALVNAYEAAHGRPPIDEAVGGVVR